MIVTTRPRLAAWSSRRARWLWGSVSLAWALGAGLITLLALVPTLWFVRETAEAGRGEKCSYCAVNVYLLQLSDGEDVGLRRVLASPRRDELLSQWRDYRHAMESTDPPPSKLAYGALDVEDQADDRATVSTDVGAVWWNYDGQGLNMHGSSHRWTFEVRRDGGGWRVWDAQPHPWCGGHVRADACG